MKIPPSEIMFAAHPGYGELPIGEAHQMTHELNRERAEQWTQEHPELPEEHNWEYVLMALKAADAEARESGLKEVRSRLAVRNPIGMTVDGIAWAAEWTGDAGFGIRGAVDRAEEALCHERKLSFVQQGLDRAGRALGRFWKPAGEYLSERANRIGEALQNARSATRNKPILLGASGALEFVSARLGAVAERLDRSRTA